MKKITVILFFLFPFILLAQAPNIQWQKTIGGNLNDVMNNIIQTDDGGFIFSGWTYSGISGDKVMNTFGVSDFWIIKTNFIGTIEWQKSYGGSNLDSCLPLIKTMDGGYLIAGNSASNISGNKTENSKGFDDYWVIKLDDLGNIQWQKTIGGNGNDDSPRVIETPDMGFLIGGFSYSNISGDKSENQIRLNPTDAGKPDYWIVKINSTGSIEWENTIGTISIDIGRTILNASDGGYIVAGYSDGDISFDKTENSKGGYDIWIMKLNDTGSIVWQKTIGGSDKDEFRNMINTSDGGYLLGAISNSNISGDKTENSKGGDDIWLVKIDAQGTILWDKTIGGSLNESFYPMVEDVYNNFYIGGYSNSNISGDKTENSKGLNDLWIVKTNNIGNIIWDKTIGGSGNDNNFALLYISSDDSVIVGGPSNSSISGDKTENSRGDNDYWIVKLEPDNLTTHETSFSTIQVYPNPTTGIVNINFGEQQEKVIATLTTVLGQVVSSETYSGIQNTSYPITGASGIYFLTLENEKNYKTVIKVFKK